MVKELTLTFDWRTFELESIDRHNAIFKVLTELVEENTTISKLHIYNTGTDILSYGCDFRDQIKANKIICEVVANFCLALEKNTSIKELSLTGAKYDYKYYLNAFTFYLNATKFTDKLLKSLSKNNSLQSLFLNKMYFRSDKYSHTFITKVTNFNSETINNFIKDNKCLTSLTSLTSLTIKNAVLPEKRNDIALMLNSLDENKTLLNLDLRFSDQEFNNPTNSSVTDYAIGDFYKKMSLVLQKNKTLQYFNTNKNYLWDFTLDTCLQSNRLIAFLNSWLVIYLAVKTSDLNFPIDVACYIFKLMCLMPDNSTNESLNQADKLQVANRILFFSEKRTEICPHKLFFKLRLQEKSGLHINNIELTVENGLAFKFKMKNGNIVPEAFTNMYQADYWIKESSHKLSADYKDNYCSNASGAKLSSNNIEIKVNENQMLDYCVQITDHNKVHGLLNYCGFNAQQIDQIYQDFGVVAAQEKEPEPAVSNTGCLIM